MKNLKTMTKMEPELYATSISEINNFIERIANQEVKKISANNVKVEKTEKNKDELIEVGQPRLIHLYFSLSFQPLHY